MHRQILISCLPYLVTLAILFAALCAVLRFSGARLRFARIREVHRCEAGGVQSLAFVLTLPLFLMIVMFIAQIGLMMIGNITVNTAAFAAARAAAVWIPAEVEHPTDPNKSEPENTLSGGIAPNSAHQSNYSEWYDDWYEGDGVGSKYTKIFESAVLACVPIAPSNSKLYTEKIREESFAPGRERDMWTSLARLYGQLAPRQPIGERRFARKLAYSLRNTLVIISFENKDSEVGPTYNPIGHALVPYQPSEVGWQDPVTIDVWHHFALLPGPGRFLARSLTRYTGQPDEIAESITQEPGVQKTWLHGSATLTVEGIKSVRPYVQQP